METIIKIVIMVLSMIIMVEAKEDLENIIQEMKMEMNERLALNEEKLMKTQQELMELKTKNIKLEREVSFLKNPPFFHVCLWKSKHKLPNHHLLQTSLLLLQY